MAYDQWHKRMAEEKESGTIDRYVREELHDMSWWSTGDIVVNALNLEQTKGVKLLDLGSGWGRVAHSVNSRVPDIDYQGVELTKELADTSRKVLQEFPNAKVENTDFFSFESEQKYTHAMSLRVVHYFDDAQKKQAFQKLHSLLDTNGKIFIAIPNKYNPIRWYQYKHAPLFSGKQLNQIVRDSGFRVDTCGSYNFMPPIRKLGQNAVLKGLEKTLRAIPLLKYIGGLWYVTATKID